MNSKKFLTFLQTWGTKQRLSSAYYPQSNGRAEAAVKSAKRIITDNIGPRGTISNDKVAQALLQHRNTPLKGTGTGASPAQLLMGRNLRDFVPSPPLGYKVSRKWINLLRKREEVMTENITKASNSSSDRVHLDELPVGTEVLCQNMQSKRWDKSGLVVEACEFRQYKIKLNGSGRITLRNRIHLRPVKIFKSTPIIVDHSTRNPAKIRTNTTNSTTRSCLSNIDSTNTPSSNGFTTPSSNNGDIPVIPPPLRQRVAEGNKNNR